MYRCIAFSILGEECFPIHKTQVRIDFLFSHNFLLNIDADNGDCSSTPLNGIATNKENTKLKPSNSSSTNANNDDR
jgi:hypothetical protein